MEVVDFIEEIPVFFPFEKGGIESLREETPPALTPVLSPGERENHGPTQCRPRRPVIGRTQTQARAMFSRRGFMRIGGAKRVRNPSGIGLAVGFGRTATRDERDGTGPQPKSASARQKPVTDRRSASHRRVRLAVSPFNFSTF
jgi:hypothetical protein